MPPIEAALIKPVVDALLSLFKQGDNLRLKRNAEAALREAIRELLLAQPDENKAEAKIAIARAAGILSEDILLAEDMLEKHRETKHRTAGKAGSGRRRKTAAASDTEAAAKRSKASAKPTEKPADKPATSKTKSAADAASDPKADGKPPAKSPRKPPKA
jgi:hypothetical protein